jgi:uncharacterized protein YutE (UPF0331/DUF86 family)
MIDDVLLNKAATVERCVRRACEEYDKNRLTFADDFTRQDAAILNIQRSCEACLDMGHHLIRKEMLGLPQSVRDVFAILVQAKVIPQKLGEALQAMVGFRNIAVHDYQKLLLPIAEKILAEKLDDLLDFSKQMVRRNGNPV